MINNKAFFLNSCFFFRILGLELKIEKKSDKNTDDNVKFRVFIRFIVESQKAKKNTYFKGIILKLGKI